MKRSLLLAAVAALLGAPAVHAQNLLLNPEFDTSVANWTKPSPASAIEVSFDGSYDVDGDPASGAARLTSTQANAGGEGSAGPPIVQCVAVDPDTLYRLSGNALVPGAQTNGARPDMQLIWFSVSDCGACPVEDPVCFEDAGSTNQHTGVTDRWEALGLNVVSPVDAISANVLLRPRKVEAGGSVDALFDGLYLPEPDGAAAGLAALVALAALSGRR